VEAGQNRDFAGLARVFEANYAAMKTAVSRFALVAALVAAALSSACQDAGTKKKLDELAARVDKLEKGGGGGDVAGRVAKLEKFVIALFMDSV
jgi:endonuclease III